MSEVQPIVENESTSSTKMLIAMVGIGLICALLIVVSYEGTMPRIERLKAEALEKAIFNVIPGITKTKTFQLEDDKTFKEVNADEKGKQLVYAGYDEADKLVGIAVEASGQGYADIIRVLYGYSPSTQTIVGLYVLESKETPGLGDKIEKDISFTNNFIALDVSLTEDHSAIKNIITTVKSGTKNNPWEVDGITGATISSRAIGDLLGVSTQEMMPLLYQQVKVFEMNKSEIK